MKWFLIALLVAAGCDDDSAAPPANSDMSACNEDAAARCLIVDDGGLSHGCMQGGNGPGDRDDGGGMALAGPPDLGADMMNLPYSSPCLFNQQCTTGICFLYKVKGQFCTQFCACDSDCPPPSLGCGGQGVCRMGD
jgi:hypothetical protein